MKRIFTAALVGVTACVSGVAVPAAAEQAGGANHVVMATTTADGSALARSGIQVAPAGGPTNDSTNLARAAAFDCNGCRSVAAALQAVLLISDPSTVTSTNAAVATNQRCIGCTSYAFAYQYVVTADGPVYITTTGRKDIEGLRAEVAAVAASGGPVTEIDARLEQLKEEFRAVIDSEMRSAGRHFSSAAYVDRDTALPEAAG
jgi:hypothetical protein